MADDVDAGDRDDSERAHVSSGRDRGFPYEDRSPFCAPLSNLLRFVPLEAAIEVPRAAEVDAGPGPASAEVDKEVGVAARLLVRLWKGVWSDRERGGRTLVSVRLSRRRQSRLSAGRAASPEALTAF